MLLLDEQPTVTAVASIDAPGIAAFAVQTDDAGETSPARRRGPARGRGRAPAGTPRSRWSAGRAPGRGQWRGDPAVAGCAGHRVRSRLHRSDPRAYRGGRRNAAGRDRGACPYPGPAVRLRHPPRSAGCLLPIRGCTPAGRRRPAQCRSGWSAVAVEYRPTAPLRGGPRRPLLPCHGHQSRLHGDRCGPRGVGRKR